MNPLVLLLALLASSPGGEVHVDPLRGFRLELPEGWSVREQEGGSERGYTLTLKPPDSSAGAAVAVQIGERRAGEELAAIFARDLERVRSGERFSGLEVSELELAGRVAPTLGVSYRAASGEYRIRRSHLVEGRSSFVLQCNAFVDQYPEQLEVFDRIVGSFSFIELSEEGRAARRLSELAARCGSEIEWARDWPEAAERARREERPVLVVAWLLASFTRANTARHGIFMDPELIELVNRRFVPLWYERGMKAPFVESYGVSSSAFGKGLLAMTPDGEVIFQTHELDDPSVAHEFLRRRLADHPEFPGAPPAADLAPLERAASHLARGELERATEALEGQHSARAHRLRARILALQRRGDEALRALDAARAAGGEDEGLRILEASVWMRLGRDEEARAAFEEVLADRADTDPPPEALYRLSLLDWRRRDGDAAERRWRALIEQHPENRFAWLAAQALESASPSDPVWPEEPAVAEVVAPRESAPLAPERAARATRDALAWLVAAQQPDGSWISPTEVGGGRLPGPEPFVDSITALAGSALLRHRELEGVEPAVREALRFVLASITSRERTPPFTWVMDYTPWSDSCMLTFLAEAHEKEVAERAALSRAAASLIADLASRRQSGGGWCYLVTGGARAGAPPVHSISFVTAAVVLALDRARAAGFEVPPGLIEDGAACLERMRNEDDSFEYRLVHASEDAPRDTALPGAVGRGPVCELALQCAGRSSPERLRRALELFLEHSAIYAAESGKVLAHAGPSLVGCHYLLFDCAHAARAQRALPADPGTTLRLRELILESRLSDGSFTDNPVVGRAYATAMALLALDELERAEEG